MNRKPSPFDRLTDETNAVGFEATKRLKGTVNTQLHVIFLLISAGELDGTPHLGFNRR